jgi:hypothetical protein
MGFYASAVTIVLMILFAIPTLLRMPLLQPGVIFGYIILILASLGHSISYFQLVECTGAVATGVLQALRAVGVFGISHVWFCDIDKGQCYTAWKGLATIVVVLGVLAFAAGKALGPKTEDKGRGLLEVWMRKGGAFMGGVGKGEAGRGGRKNSNVGVMQLQRMPSRGAVGDAKKDVLFEAVSADEFDFEDDDEVSELLRNAEVDLADIHH